MDVKSKGVPLIMFFLFVLLSAIFPPPFSAANQLLHKKKPSPIIPTHSLVSSTVFPIRGNVYPHGGYSVAVNIGNPQNVFHLKIDPTNDLTWVECDVQCNGCPAGNNVYKPHANFVNCSDPLCVTQLCSRGKCLYDVYSGDISSVGAIVKDPIYPTTSPQLLPEVAFGCGFDQDYSESSPPPSTRGVLGLGNGNISILSQLHSQGLIRNVMGHCLSSQGGGFLFYGDEFISSPSLGRFVWTPMVPSSSGKYYNTGPADLLFSGKATSVEGLQLNFDCGNTYTYFNSQAYQAVLDMVNNDLQGKPLSKASEDPSLPICWKGVKPFKSLHHVRSYFKPLALSFTKSKNSQLLLPPQAYLIITDHGNVCLGILNGTEMGFGKVNIVGAISLQDKIIIYDNEYQQIGWAPAKCDGP